MYRLPCRERFPPQDIVTNREPPSPYPAHRDLLLLRTSQSVLPFYQVYCEDYATGLSLECPSSVVSPRAAPVRSAGRPGTMDKTVDASVGLLYPAALIERHRVICGGVGKVKLSALDALQEPRTPGPRRSILTSRGSKK